MNSRLSPLGFVFCMARTALIAIKVKVETSRESEVVTIDAESGIWEFFLHAQSVNCYAPSAVTESDTNLPGLLEDTAGYDIGGYPA